MDAHPGRAFSAGVHATIGRGQFNGGGAPPRPAAAPLVHPCTSSIGMRPYQSLCRARRSGWFPNYRPSGQRPVTPDPGAAPRRPRAKWRNKCHKRHQILHQGTPRNWDIRGNVNYVPYCRNVATQGIPRPHDPIASSLLMASWNRRKSTETINFRYRHRVRMVSTGV